MKKIALLFPVIGTLTLLSACIGGGHSSHGTGLHRRIATQSVRTEIAKNIYYFKTVNAEQAVEHITLSKARSKSGTFTVLTLFSDDLEILQVEIRDYPYTHGRGVKKHSYLRSLNGWDGTKKVDSVTGSTISCRALLKSVKTARDALRAKLGDT